MSGRGPGAGFGLILAFGAGALLVWNESRSLSMDDSLRLGAATVTRVAADRIDPANEGKLVFLRGTASGAPIVDPDTGVRLEALAAARKVEMLQWREQSTRRGGAANASADAAGISLSKVWSERAEPTTVYMQAQRLSNPPLPLGERRLTAEGVRLGAFALSAEALAALPKSPAGAEPKGFILGRPVTRAGDALLVSESPQAPVVGDLRIAYALAPPGEISLVGRQVDGRIAAHRDAQGERVMLAARGLRSPEDMFDAARGGNTFMTWVARAFGALAMWGGFALLLRRLTAIGELIPVVGGVLASGSRAVAFVAAAAVSGLTIAGGWLLARPTVLLAAAALLAALVFLARRRKAGAPASPHEDGARAATELSRGVERSGR